jgi:hypothetical protein
MIFVHPDDSVYPDERDVFNDHALSSSYKDADTFAFYVQSLLDTLRQPMMTYRPMKRMLRAVPISIMLDNFSKVSKNIFIMGPKTLTLAFARGAEDRYVTAVTSKQFHWCDSTTRFIK